MLEHCEVTLCQRGFSHSWFASLHTCKLFICLQHKFWKNLVLTNFKKSFSYAGSVIGFEPKNLNDDLTKFWNLNEFIFIIAFI